MNNQNITLSIPKNVLKKIKHIAVEKNTSVSKLLTEQLILIAAKEDDYQKAKAAQLHLLKEGFDMGIENKTDWKRDELYDR
ncbi:CopG family transcriptional regulator [Candidatus Contubernalis alkaliaceticus]|uniref:CopG family transcriptional regulator n=1 Tax=Candidatus Contubernalis alkaliaceticus TaxID=338645 RepID=UPI001F4C1FC2|nr:CopG family transcriptional regulator [Candidatus Contubernalis alkalaceticus]UNC91314.1 CopG family transcriptional regulator [Candidatus Contubernalis alkalaceticus]